MTDKNETYNFDSTNLFNYILERRKPLIIIVGIAAVVSFVIAYFFITPEYRSTVTIFPASSSSVSHELLNENLIEKNILKFGEEEEVEQLMQVLQSDEIRNRIIRKHRLMEHYQIDSVEYFKTRLINRYNGNVSIERTEFMSIKIEVLDINAKKAADIANDISAYLDTVMNRMQKERAVRALNIVESQYNSLKAYIDELQDSMLSIRRLGIFDYESQSEVFNDAYATALAEGRLEGAKKLEEKLHTLAEYGGAYASIRDLLIYEIEKLSVLESKYQEAKVDVEQDLPHKFVVDHAVEADKAAYPKKGLIVIVSMIIAFILALLLLIVFDNVKKKSLENI